MKKEEKSEEIHEKENLLWILKETKKALKKQDVVKIKELSNRTVHSASTSQDVDSISIAILIYSLSKILERKKYTSYDDFPSFYKSYVFVIDKSIRDLERNNVENFRRDIGKIRKITNNLSGNFKKYIKDVFRKAQINKASRIYEHGISMEQTAKLLGITIWELAEYAGQTGISDVNLTNTLPIKKRIKTIEDMFK